VKTPNLATVLYVGGAVGLVAFVVLLPVLLVAGVTFLT
jgi:hypothetical protein